LAKKATGTRPTSAEHVGSPEFSDDALERSKRLDPRLASRVTLTKDYLTVSVDRLWEVSIRGCGLS
jgi:hypothetical protein